MLLAMLIPFGAFNVPFETVEAVFELRWQLIKLLGPLSSATVMNVVASITFVLLQSNHSLAELVT
jgi:hypothetical protein